MTAHLKVAVSIHGRIFYHPCDGSAAAIKADRAAKARGDYPYQHLFEGDNVDDIVQNMLDEQELDTEQPDE